MENELDLQAKILEYEHALEHAVDCAVCLDYTRLARSALDGVNRADFRDLAKWRKSD